MKLIIDAGKKEGYISPEIYGHFSEHLGRGIYEGIYVGEDSPIPNVDGIRKDVLDALKEIEVPVLRWPGGCFADEYHWKDGIGPKEQRKKMVNTNWGGVTEDNSFGTHEFMRLCELLGCKAYINGNLGTGTAREMSEWVEYMTGTGSSPMTELRRQNGREEPWKVDFFAVGNESWGCGGNMRAPYYADLYRHYQTFLRNYDPEHPIQKICVGPGTPEIKWTEEVLKACFEDAPANAHGFMDYITIHHYVVPDTWSHKGSATAYPEELWYKSLNKARFMETIIQRNENVLNKYDPEGKIALCVDEWGGWYDVEPGTNPGFLYQQSTIRDALIASLTFDIFHRHCKRVRMANIAQMVNVLQSVLLTEGSEMVKTPTFYLFKMYKNHQGGEVLANYLTDVETEGFGEEKEDAIPVISASASEKEGVITVTITNCSLTKEETLEVSLLNTGAENVIHATILSADSIHDFNDFRKEEKVTEKPFSAYQVKEGSLNVTLPAHSVVLLRLK